MNYYLKETEARISETVPQAHKMTASFKPRVDVDTICEEVMDGYVCCGFPIGVHGILNRLRSYRMNLREWESVLAPLKSGDSILIQHPQPGFNPFQNKLYKMLKKRGVRIIFFVHDLDWLRMKKMNPKVKLHMHIEKKAFRYADSVILHNDKMAERLPNIKANKITLGIFDYLSDDKTLAKRGVALPIIVAGNLSREKAGYLYSLPGEAEWNLYGPYYTAEAENVNYKGAFPSEVLPSVLEGSFGLVWDGDSADSCVGAMGEYLRFNDPYKASLYLACGLPIIIWRQAALADFVLSHDCGIVVDSLSEIPQKTSLSEERYAELCANAEKVGEQLRVGHYTKLALSRVYDKEE